MAWIDLEGAVNVRDLGGLATADDRRTACRRMLRGDNLQGLTQSDVGALVRGVGLTAVVDLRSTAELVSEGPAPLDGVASVGHFHHPLLPEEEGSANRVTDVLLPYGDRERLRCPGDPRCGQYLGYLEDSPGQVTAALRSIANSSGAVLVHCAAGKDRTAVLVAIALSAVGVCREAIVADYAASGERIDAIMKRLRGSPTYAWNVDSKPAGSHVPRPETMGTFLEQVEARHGGVIPWLAVHGFGGYDVALLHAKLLLE
jgi:protein-tyrosine phosphatase